MTGHYNDDGNSTILTDDDRIHITAEVTHLDAELMQCRESRCSATYDSAALIWPTSWRSAAVSPCRKILHLV